MQQPLRRCVTKWIVGLVVIGGTTSAVTMWQFLVHSRLDRELVTAVHRRDGASVRLLLDEGADPNSCEAVVPPQHVIQRLVSIFRPRRGDPAIVVLFDFDHPARVGNDPYGTILKLLLDHGADPCSRSADGLRSVLSVSCMYATPESVRLLITRGALRGESEESIGKIVARSDLPIAEVLLSNGASVNSRMSGGITALMLAQTASTVRLFLKYGANPYLVDDSGRDTMAWLKLEAAGRGLLDKDEYTAIVRELNRHGIYH